MNGDALKQLNDIHLPPPETWWHLPWGVWLLLGCVCLLALLITWAWRPFKQRYQSKKSKKACQQEITHEIQAIEQVFKQTGDSLVMVSALSILLRRVSITLFKDEHVEGLIQSEWLKFLDRKWKKTPPEHCFTSDHIGTLLSTIAYRKTLDESLKHDAQNLLDVSKRWLHEVSHV